MNYFTSDLHLGHRNIIRLCNRPFATIEEMDETLIRNWNAKVTNGDTVYILGDLLFRNEKPAEEYLKQLKGKKHPIIGNHDRDWVKKCNLEDFFESVNNLHFISDGKRQMRSCFIIKTPSATRRQALCLDITFSGLARTRFPATLSTSATMTSTVICTPSILFSQRKIALRP